MQSMAQLAASTSKTSLMQDQLKYQHKEKIQKIKDLDQQIRR